MIQLQSSHYSFNGKYCPFLEQLLEIIPESSTIRVQSGQVQDQFVHPLKYFRSKSCLVNTSFQAVFITPEALTPLRLLSPFTSSLYSSNSSSRTCKLPEINEYRAFHQAHAPRSFQYLKHTIVSKL